MASQEPPPPRRRSSTRQRSAETRSAAAGRLVDGFAKQLIAIAPAFWATWATQQTDLIPAAPLDPEFRLVFRQTDTLLPVTTADGQPFLILFELQYAFDPDMPLRMFAYIAVAWQRYQLPVFPVVINFQPPPAGSTTPTRFAQTWLGLGFSCEYRVINLWEIPAERAFEPDAAALLVLLPFLAGGQRAPLLERAMGLVRHHQLAPDLELFLLYLIHKVGGDALLNQLGERLDMAMLQKTAWFQDIIEEGLAEGRRLGREEGLRLGREEGREQGRQEGRDAALRQAIQRILEQRFGPVPDTLEPALAAGGGECLESLMTAALAAPSLAAFTAELNAALECL